MIHHFKTILVGIALLLLGADVLKAQYSKNRLKYDFRTYDHMKEDKFNPVVSGIASGCIPGLGQMIGGEIGRGIAFLSGGIIVPGLVFVGLYYAYLEMAGGYFLLLAAASYWTWNIVDAVRVAKVNSLAYRDRAPTGCTLGLSPYTTSVGNGQDFSIGLRLSLGF